MVLVLTYPAGVELIGAADDAVTRLPEEVASTTSVEDEVEVTTSVVVVVVVDISVASGDVVL